MTNEEYKKLNQYLNLVFNELEQNDSFLLQNIHQVSYLSAKIRMMMKDIPLENKSIQNKMTFEDVYLLAREIIESIDESYLINYDNLIKSGKLDFDYEGEKYESSFFHVKHQLINIVREFNYTDVIILVHEFFHMTNFTSEKTSIYRYLLSEFFSIYFEIYAEIYLLQKGIPKQEIDIDFRLRDTKRVCNDFDWYSVILLAFKYFGNIDENTTDLLNKKFLNITSEQFCKHCKHVLRKFLNVEEKYQKDVLMQNEYSEKELVGRLSSGLSQEYRYILGTVMALYAHKYSNMKDIVYLNNHINDEAIQNKTLNEVLNMIHIDIENPNFNNDLLFNLEEVLKESGKRK